jgi:DNA-binding CsgD family transcriptional regulator
MTLVEADTFGPASNDPRPAPPPTSHPGGGWHATPAAPSQGLLHLHVLGDIVRAIGERDFAAIAARRILAFMEFELGAVVVHPEARPPYLLFDNFETAEASEGLRNYVAFTHAVNPMRAPGAFRARDFARGTGIAMSNPYLVPSPAEELGYRTLGWPERLEEIGLYFQLLDGLVELSVYRPRGRRPAPADKLAGLEALRGPIAAAFERHAQLLQRETSLPPTAFDDGLTPREAEVLHLLLAGCGSEAIALRLALSRHTVKDYRKRIFRKLSVTSLAELFALRRSQVPAILPPPAHPSRVGWRPTRDARTIAASGEGPAPEETPCAMHECPSKSNPRRSSATVASATTCRRARSPTACSTT